MVSRPHPSANQADDAMLLDVQERRRSLKRGKEGRPGSPDKDEPLESDPSLPIEPVNSKRTGMRLPAVDQLEGHYAEQPTKKSAWTETTADSRLASGPMPAAPAKEAPPPEALRVGRIEDFHSNKIRGWAWHPERPGEPTDLEVLADDVVVLRACANLLRDDLPALPSGDRYHGFLVENIGAYLPPDTKTIRIRRKSDGMEIYGSPIAIEGLQRAAENHEASVEAGTAQRSMAVAAATAQHEPHEPATPHVGAQPDDAIPSGLAREAASIAAPDNALPMGNIDRIDYDEISGWAWDPNYPDESIDIEILDDGVVVLKVPADQFRPDLAEAGAGSGYHGFSVKNLGGVFPLSRHRVSVCRASDRRDLPESPVWISRPGLDHRAAEFIGQVMVSAVQAAVKPEDLAQPLNHLLLLLNDVINAREYLAQSQKSVSPLASPESAEYHLTGQTRDLVDHLRYIYKPLYFEPSEQPVVSVIIPVYNKFSVTYDCLRSITQALPRRSFEIVIVDDCSDDETMLTALVFAGAVRIVRNVQNSGFVRTCNAGAAVAKGRYLLFLNNDTLVKEGWLDELVETFEQVPDVGIAGSKLLFEDGKLQEAGGIIWRLGDGWNWGRGRDPAEPIFSYLRDADWVSGAALMIESTLFQTLGGFDDMLAPGYYEDTDLAFRVRALGKRVVMQPASQIVHLEGVSSGTDTSGTGMKRYQVINHAKFYQRWKDTLLTHRFNGQHPELEAERQVRRRAYFIDDTVPTPDQDAGSNAAIEHMRALMALGYKVTFLPADNMAKIDPYTAALQKLGIECQYYPYYWSVEEVFRKATNKPDLVYLHRYTNASKYATMVRRYFPDCRVVYSIADLHFLRMERQAAIEPGSINSAQMASQRRSEISAMLNVDSVIVHSVVEAKLLRDAEPALNIEVVPWTVRVRPPPLPFAKRSGLAFVGGFGHPPNVDAVHHLLSDILPLLRRGLCDPTTYLVGSKMPEAMTNMQVPGVLPVGFVPVLGDILHRLRLTVVPLRYGAGIKGKVLESFAHGLPCVMTEVAAEGLELPDDLAWLVASTPDAFAEKIARVHEDEGLNCELSKAGLAYIERRHSAGVVTEALRAAVAG